MNLRSEVVRIFNELLGDGKKITQLPDADLPLTGSEYVEIVQDGINKKVQVIQLPGGGSSIPTNAVLYDDLTAVFYDDLTNLLYDT